MPNIALHAWIAWVLTAALEAMQWAITVLYKAKKKENLRKGDFYLIYLYSKRIAISHGKLLKLKYRN